MACTAPEETMPGPRDAPGGPYTLGNDGAVAATGLEVPPVFVPAPDADADALMDGDVSGESGRDNPERGVSLMRVNEYVRSRDCARF